MIMIEDNFFVRDDRKTGNFVLINNVGKGKLFANPVEQAAANVLLNKNPKYFSAMPSRSPGFVIGATFEGAGEKIGEDLGSYYTEFINLTNMAWVGFGGANYTHASTNCTVPRKITDDVFPDEGWAKFESRGSSKDGRQPVNLNESLKVQQVRADPEAGVPIKLSKGGLTDERWPAREGWIKLAQNIEKTEIHYVYNTLTGWVDDIKIK